MPTSPVRAPDDGHLQSHHEMLHNMQPLYTRAALLTGEAVSLQTAPRAMRAADMLLRASAQEAAALWIQSIPSCVSSARGSMLRCIHVGGVACMHEPS